MEKIKQNVVIKMLNRMILDIVEDENIDKERLDRFDRAISWARKRGYETHQYETISKCYHHFLRFDSEGFYKNGGCCGDISGLSCEDYYDVRLEGEE